MFSTKPIRFALKVMGSRRVHIIRSCMTVIVLIELALVAGCASTKQYAPISKGSGTAPSHPNLVRIYLMRPSITGSAEAFEVQEGKTAVGKVGPRGYLCWERPPGEDPNP